MGLSQAMDLIQQFSLPPRSLWFADLAALTPLFDWQRWPEPGALPANALAVRFVDDDAGSSQQRLSYEQQIFDRGLVPTRRHNWHDIYNALIWNVFPQTKRALNHAHVAAMAATASSGGRGARRDALTQFDECGVVLVATDPQWLAPLAVHDWRRLFIDQQPLWFHQLRPYLFGHALYESLAAPFIGLCGKALMVVVDPPFVALPLASRYRWLDQQLAAAVAQGLVLNRPRQLAPLPLLGVPGAWPANLDPEFYGNQDYFRPLRQPRPQPDLLDLRGRALF